MKNGRSETNVLFPFRALFFSDTNNLIFLHKDTKSCRILSNKFLRFSTITVARIYWTKYFLSSSKSKYKNRCWKISRRYYGSSLSLCSKDLLLQIFEKCSGIFHNVFDSFSFMRFEAKWKALFSNDIGHCLNTILSLCSMSCTDGNINVFVPAEYYNVEGLLWLGYEILTILKIRLLKLPKIAT